MTENKRFELTMRGNEVAQYEIIDHNQENLTVYNDLGCVYFSSAMKVCELLNNLENENEQLKEENKELKQELKDYHNAFDCSQCRYQNYDWFGDGEEFEVCDKGNNEAQMDNHSCKEWEEL